VVEAPARQQAEILSEAVAIEEPDGLLVAVELVAILGEEQELPGRAELEAVLTCPG
jgi:hypothetical protein